MSIQSLGRPPTGEARFWEAIITSRTRELDALMKDLKHPDHQVRRNLIRHLFYAQDARAPALLARMANGDGDSHIRFLARKALHLLERRAAVTPRSMRMTVMERLRSPDAGVRQSAIWEMMKTREPRALETLSEILSLETNPFVRTAAARALSRIGGTDAILLPRGPLTDSSERVRAAAVDSLAEIGQPDTCRDVLIMTGDPDARVHLAARKASFSFGMERVLSTLKSLAAAESPILREEVVRILDRLRIADLAALLHQARDDRSESVRTVACAVRPGSSLTEGSPISTVLEELSRLPLDIPFPDPLGSPDPSVRKEEIREIVCRRQLSRIPDLAQSVSGETDSSVRASMIMALGLLKARDCGQVLEGSLKDPDGRVRANAVEALGLLEDPSVLKNLVPLLRDPSPRVRANAIVALKRTRGVDVTSVLKEMVESPEKGMVFSAIYAITDLNSSPVTVLLKPLLLHECPTIRTRVMESLEIMRRNGNMVAGAMLAEMSQAGSVLDTGFDFNEQEGTESL